MNEMIAQRITVTLTAESEITKLLRLLRRHDISTDDRVHSFTIDRPRDGYKGDPIDRASVGRTQSFRPVKKAKYNTKPGLRAAINKSRTRKVRCDKGKKRGKYE